MALTRTKLGKRFRTGKVAPRTVGTGENGGWQLCRYARGCRKPVKGIPVWLCRVERRKRSLPKRAARTQVKNQKAEERKGGDKCGRGRIGFPGKAHKRKRFGPAGTMRANQQQGIPPHLAVTEEKSSGRRMEVGKSGAHHETNPGRKPSKVERI